MARVQLVSHDLSFAERMWELVSNPKIKDVLGIPDESVKDTRNFIQWITQEEQNGNQLSRVILNENGEFIGVTTLMSINRERKRCHVGTWIGQEYWGMGYNHASKIEILKIAFQELGLVHVLAGARKTNIRSQKAQEKLPYIRLNVEDQFPDEHEFLENKEQQPCVLHAFFKNDFEKYVKENASSLQI
ncbi:GNAT family N-acetyltransferase [Alicyclobacillus fastidiosus]|uniref:GNAT family N-acetyltransferase n=1 Tax=Alicyclobacillus fastidiosus TaxID=392011 RepID=A0ABY6ZGK6_9BACL|nr:GNAT family N-acetyltransferase [Alicyclobacillus fastidiosus]WAH41346.1 GNAT family N-acetyltransferase [Alicyclobacillus fastidiosus]GMA62955.1 N-acetyltransferase [Alicyclobacillus fastidiosus]